MSKLAPTSLMGCIDHLAEHVYRTKHNATVDAARKPLTADYENALQKMASYNYYGEKIAGLVKPLHKLHLHKYISLVQSEGQAAIAIALNAGDGIVVKLTASEFLHKEDDIMPGRLPPIYRENIDGIAVEIFPWVDRKRITENDVHKVKERLRVFGLQFRHGDDRPDNVGRMPNGELVVLDGDALEPVPGVSIKPEAYQTMQTEWKKHIHECFYPLYSDVDYTTGVKRLISESPNFEERFSPLITKNQKIDAKSHPAPTSFLARFMRPSSENGRG